MSDKKHIDDLFRAGLSGFSVSPDQVTRSNIEGAFLASTSSSAKWIYYSAATLILLIASLGGWFYVSNQPMDASEISNKLLIEIPSNQIDYSNVKKPSSELVEKELGKLLSANDDAVEIIGEPNEKYSHQQVNLSLKETASVSKTNDQTNIALSNNENTFSSTNKENSISPSFYKDITFLKPLNLSFDVIPVPNIIDPEKVIGMQAYLDKKKKSHFYTGLSATAAMMYYPSTKDQFTWSADLSLGLTAGKFYFESGIGYQAVKEQGIYNIEFRSQDSVGYYNEVISFEVNPLNANEIVFKTEEVTVYDSINHYTHATPTFSYNYLNVPLIVGYRVFEKEKLSVGIETGIRFSFMVSKDIPQVGFNYPEYTHIKTIDETPERVEINYQWLIAVRLNYRLAKSMSLSVKPVFNKYINSVYDTKNGYPNMKPYSMGIQVGLYYGF